MSSFDDLKNQSLKHLNEEDDVFAMLRGVGYAILLLAEVINQGGKKSKNLAL